MLLSRKIGKQEKKKAAEAAFFLLLLLVGPGDLVDNVAQALSAVLQLAFLLSGEGSGNVAGDAVLANDGNGGEANVVNAVLAVHHGGNGESGLDAAEDNLADIHSCACYGIEGSALASDNLTAGLANVLLNCIVIDGVLGVEYLLVVVNVGGADHSLRPRNKGAVTVLAVNVSVTI